MREQKSQKEAESQKGRSHRRGGAAEETDMSLQPDAAASVGGDYATEGRTGSRYHLWHHRCRGRLPEGWC